MAYLSPLIVAACRQRGITAEWFPVRLETEPGQTFDHQWIYQQIDRANAWLAAQPGADDTKAMLHFHTDSGTMSHTFGIYPARQMPLSKRLAGCVAGAVRQALGTERLATFDRLGDTDYNTYVFAQQAKFTVALIELCSHQSERDMAALFGRPGDLAAAIAEGLAEYWALPAPASAGEDRLRTSAAQAIALMEQAMALLRGANA